MIRKGGAKADAFTAQPARRKRVFRLIDTTGAIPTGDSDSNVDRITLSAESAIQHHRTAPACPPPNGNAVQDYCG
jgi:hypothetical protein